MLVIKRLQQTNEGHHYEPIATYENGKFRHDQDVAEGLAGLEGLSEEQIQRSLDGPHTIAVRPGR